MCSTRPLSGSGHRSRGDARTAVVSGRVSRCGFAGGGARADTIALRERLRSGPLASDGFTVAELVIAMAILLVVLIGVLDAVQFAAAATQQASVRQGALQLATQKVEYARNIPYQALGTKQADGTFGDPAGILSIDGESVTTTAGVYTVAYEVSWKRKSDPNPAARTVMYKQLKVTVSWEAPRPGSVSLETAIYGIDMAGVVGDVQVFAQDVDTFAALQGVQVTLGPASGPNRMVATGSDGYSSFGQVPYGAVRSMTAVKSGYMADYATFGPKTVAPNVVNTWSVLMQQPKNATIHVQNALGPIQGASVTLTNQERGITYGPFGTDANGNTPPIPNLWNAAAAGYKATATYNGNISNSTFVIRSVDTAVVSTIVLVAKLRVTVIDAYGPPALPLSGRTVTVKDGASVMGGGTTDALGQIGLVDIATGGTYAVSVAANGNYQAFSGSLSISLTDPSPVQYTAAVVTGRIQVQVRKADGTSLPSSPSDYQVRLNVNGNDVNPQLYDSSTATAQFSPLAIGTYTVRVKIANGSWNAVAVAPATGLSLSAGDFTRHSVVYSGAN